MHSSRICRSKDLERFFRGLGLIFTESARMHGPEVAEAMKNYSNAASGFVHTMQMATKAINSQAAQSPITPPSPSTYDEQDQRLASMGNPLERTASDELAVAAGLKPASSETLAVVSSPLPSITEKMIEIPSNSAATPTFPVPPLTVERKKRTFKEVAVPASPLARVWGFGSLAVSLIGGQIGERVSRAVGGKREKGPDPNAGDGGGISSGSSPPSQSEWVGSRSTQIHISEAQADRLAEGLCRLRGAALKLGQMLSLADEALIPPQVAKVLERVRAQADVMPRQQLEAQLTEELGPDWRIKLGGDAFEDSPIAAASIGQVHRSVLPDGRRVAIKVQYPGVAESIDSDLDNLTRLLKFSNFLPKGLYLDSMVEVAREELRLECDYTHEAAAQTRYRELVSDDPDFLVPEVIPHLSTRRVLTTTWLPGVAIDAVTEDGVAGLGQEDRNRIARKLLKLTLKELFEWRFMQTDPNWGNFFYDASTRRIGLLDFGATREYPKVFVDEYLRLVWAAAQKDTKTIEEVSLRLGFLTGHESRAMLKAHCESGLVVGEPFVTAKPFDFKASGITTRVSHHGQTFADERLTAPPKEVYSLHRKLAGAFLICIRMGAVIPCRDMLQEFYTSHQWGAEGKDVERKVFVRD